MSTYWNWASSNSFRASECDEGGNECNPVFFPPRERRIPLLRAIPRLMIHMTIHCRVHLDTRVSGGSDLLIRRRPE